MSTPNPLLAAKNLNVFYGKIQAVHGIAFEVFEGEIATLIGANGAGKSSILRAISGLATYTGAIEYSGKNLAGLEPDRIVGLGIVHVPEGRGIFGSLTVMENLRLATWLRRDKPEIQRDYDRVFSLFPRLGERKRQVSGTLSGGEQQMLALGRALMSRGRLMLMDEPSMGLSPALVKEVFRTIREINATGVTILLVEQNARMALSIASRAYVLSSGIITLSGHARDIMNDPAVREAYLGG